MAKTRNLTVDELVETGLSKEQAKQIVALQNTPVPTRRKYVVFLTEEEAQMAADLTGQEFTRASKQYKKS